MSLFEVHSAASEGIVDALIAAEAMRTAILLMIELHAKTKGQECSLVAPKLRRSIRRSPF